MNKKIVFFCLLSIVSHSLIIGMQQKKAKIEFVNVCTFLDSLYKKPNPYKKDVGTYDLASQEGHNIIKEKIMGAVVATFTQAIEQKVNVVIASAALIQNILFLNDKVKSKHYFPRSMKGLASYKNTEKIHAFIKNIDKNWKIFCTENSEFGVFIKTSRNKSINLEKLGLNKNLKPITKLDQLRKIFTTPKGKVNSISVKNLNNIFEGYVPKFVFINGHGSYAKSIAQLTLAQNKSFLKTMGVTGCFFIYYSSCYVGGLNTFLLIKKDTTTKTNFPIVSGGISDTSILSTKCKFDVFFKKLSTLFNQRLNKTDAITSIYWTERPFREIAKHICGDKLQNIPSISFPGVDQLTKTIKVDDQVIVITYPYLRVVPTEIGDKKAVLMYPMILHAPLKISNNKKIPKIISMIPGQTYHYIKNIDIGNHDIKTFIKEAFTMEAQKPDKLFFLEKILYKNKKIGKAFVLKLGNVVLALILYKTNKEFTYWESLEGKTTSQKNAIKLIKNFTPQYAPEKMLLFAATGGTKSKGEFEVLYNRFLENIPKERRYVVEKEMLINSLSKANEIESELYDKLKDTILEEEIEEEKEFNYKNLFRAALNLRSEAFLPAVLRVIFDLHKNQLIASGKIKNVLDLSDLEMTNFFVPGIKKIRIKYFADLAITKPQQFKRIFNMHKTDKELLEDILQGIWESAKKLVSSDKENKDTLTKKIKTIGESSIIGLAINHAYYTLKNEYLIEEFGRYFHLLREKEIDEDEEEYDEDYKEYKKFVESLLKEKVNEKILNNALYILSCTFKPNKKTIDLCLSNIKIKHFPEALVFSPSYIKRATSLNLSGNKIVVLPQETGNLENLTDLCLDKNNIKTLPKTLKNLKKLEILDLGGNTLDEKSKKLLEEMKQENKKLYVETKI